MDNKNIDQLFKEGLGNRSFEVPTSFENDLNNSLDVLDSKKKWRLPFWLIFMSSLIDLTLIVLLLIGNTQIPVYTSLNPVVGNKNTLAIDSVHENSANGEAFYMHNSYSKKTSALKSLSPHNEASTAQLLYQEDGDVQKNHINKKGNTKGKRKSKAYHLINNKSIVQLDDSNMNKNIESKNTHLPQLTTKHQEEIHAKLAKNNNQKQLTESGLLNIQQKGESSSTKNADLSSIHKNKANDSSIHRGTTTVFVDASKKNKNKDVSSLNKADTFIEKNTEDHALADNKSKPIVSANDSSSANKQQIPNEKQHSNLSKDTKKQMHISDSTKQKEKQKPKGKTQIKKLNSKKNQHSNWRYEVQLFAGFGSTIINDRTSDKEYLTRMNQNQKPLNSPTFGLNGNIKYRNINFGIGLSYLQTGEKYTTKMNKIETKDISYLVFDTTTQVVTYYQPYGAEIGDSTHINVDTTSQTQSVSDTSVVERSVKNKYAWLSVPLRFGYQFNLGKFEIIPHVGMQFNFGIATNKGKYPTSDFEGFSTFKATQFNLSYLVDLEFKRNFNNWNLFLRPYFKSMIQPTIKESILERKYSSWGIQIGVGFDL